MPVETELTRIFELSCPVIQAPMAGGGDTAELVAEVSNAGALGCVGAAYLSPEQIIERGREITTRTSRPFGINLFAPAPAPHADPAALARAIERIAPFYAQLGLPAPTIPAVAGPNFDDQLAACLETGARMFTFTFGLLPAATIRDIRRRGLIVGGTATTVNEAKALAHAGVDIVIAQGSEAGGHRGTFATDFDSGAIGLMALLPQVIDAIAVPVMASGGIMDGRGIAAALAFGAGGAQMGTAFLTCNEAGIAPCYKDAILNAREEDTRITRAFSGRPARGIINQMLTEYRNRDEAILPFPLQNALTRPLRNEAAKRNRPEFLSLWAGQGVGLAKRDSAADLIRRLESELSNTLESLAAKRKA